MNFHITPFLHLFHFKSILIFMIGCFLQVLLWHSSGYAVTYRCNDPSGATVLTDIPAQLHDCTPITARTFGTPSVPPIKAKPSSLDEQKIPVEAQKEADSTTTSPDSGQNSDKSPEGEITVPLKKIGGSLVVQVTLNDQRSAQLIVDTGASMTVLSTDAAIALGILGTTDNELLTVNTAGGSVQVNMNYLTSLSVGSAQASNVAVAIHDLPDIPEQIEGLLGMSFLKHFLVTLDAEHSRLILRSKHRP